MRQTRLAIERAEEDVESATRAHLQSRGWKYTCQTPGSLWLYQTVLPDGRSVLANDAVALHIQDHFDGRDESESDAPVESIEEVRTIIEAGRNGVTAQAEFKGAAVKAWIGLAIDWFREVGGKSFVTMDLTDGRDGEQYTFVVQRKGGETPSDAKLAAQKAMVAHRVIHIFAKLKDFYTIDDSIKWLESNQNLLGGRCPMNLLLTSEGTEEVTALLSRLADGAFS